MDEREEEFLLTEKLSRDTDSLKSVKKIVKLLLKQICVKATVESRVTSSTLISFENKILILLTVEAYLFKLYFCRTPNQTHLNFGNCVHNNKYVSMLLLQATRTT